MSWLKRPLLAACAVSILGHVLFAMCTPERGAQAVGRQQQELEFTLSAADTSQPAESSVDTPPPPEPAPRPVEKSVRSAEALTKPVAALPIEPTVPEPTVAGPEPTAAAIQPAPARTPSAGAIDLSPRAAAATLTAEIEKQLTSGSCSVARAAGESCEGNGQVAVAAKPVQRGTGARLPGNDEYLLEPARGGGYVHKSLGFNARIEPNGDVHFDDKLRDLNDVVNSMIGEQAYTAQKRRFLAQTSELRDQLAAEARARAQVHGLGELAHQLQRILADASRSALQKRVAVFALWDDCANDTLGAEAQHKIERFVRENMPEGGALAYAVGELAELNRRRVSKRVFAPYAAIDAGARPG